MIEISNIEVYGLKPAILSIRNSWSSYAKSDSDDETIGKADLALAEKLAKCGGPEAKFRRMIHVTCNIRAPRYWWMQFDTYKIGTVSNSESTMHTIVNREFRLSDFSTSENMSGLAAIHLINTIDILNELRQKYMDEVSPMVKKMYWYDIITLLPQSYMQMRTVDLNYEVLSQMLKYRHNHKLDEWKGFCEKMMYDLPYAKELIFDQEEK